MKKTRQVQTGSRLERFQARLNVNKHKKPRDRHGPDLAPAFLNWCKKQVDRSAIRVRENPKPAKVEAKVERQQGWARAGKGARLGASSTNTLTETPLNPKPYNLSPKS